MASTALAALSSFIRLDEAWIGSFLRCWSDWMGQRSYLQEHLPDPGQREVVDLTPFIDQIDEIVQKITPHMFMALSDAERDVLLVHFMQQKINMSRISHVLSTLSESDQREQNSQPHMRDDWAVPHHDEQSTWVVVRLLSFIKRAKGPLREQLYMGFRALGTHGFTLTIGVSKNGDPICRQDWE